MKKLFFTVFCALVGCGSSDGAPQADSCLTPGTAYLVSFNEVSGDCGPIASGVVNINPDGTIPEASYVTCQSSVAHGCTVQNTDCSYTASGDTITFTSDATFASDGSGGRGVESISVESNVYGESCAATYDVTFMRQ